MPTYEYKCTNCEHQFEIWQEVGAEPPECPECSSAVRKIFHPVSVHYKGSGFYITDSRGDTKKTEAKSEAKSEPKNGDAKDSGEKSTATEPSASESSASESSVSESSKAGSKPATDSPASKSTTTEQKHNH